MYPDLDPDPDTDPNTNIDSITRYFAQLLKCRHWLAGYQHDWREAFFIWLIRDARITDVDPFIPVMTVATTLHN